MATTSPSPPASSGSPAPRPMASPSAAGFARPSPSRKRPAPGASCTSTPRCRSTWTAVSAPPSIFSPEPSTGAHAMDETTANDAQTSAIAARGGIIPYLALDGAGKAADFYGTAFGAQDVARVPAQGDDGRFIHIHLILNGQSLMLSDPFPEHGHAYKEPAGVTLHLQVTDINR